MERHEAGCESGDRPLVLARQFAISYIKLAYLNQGKVSTGFVEVLRCGLACATDFFRQVADSHNAISIMSSLLFLIKASCSEWTLGVSALAATVNFVADHIASRLSFLCAHRVVVTVHVCRICDGSCMDKEPSGGAFTRVLLR